MGRLSTPVRLFFALRPDTAARQALAVLPRPPGGRAVHPDDLHLTLAFLGELRAPSVDVLLESVAGATAGRGPVAVVMDRVETWPGPRAACAVGDSPAAAALAAVLWQQLPVFGYRPDERPFRAHVTLARGLPRTVGSSVGPLPDPVRWASRELLLLASDAVPRPPGTPRYDVLGARPLD